MTARRHTGAVAAGHQLTAESAANILRDGGTVFDAAIAGLWTACVVEPVLASPGGGGFLMARQAGMPVRLFDFFAQTPGNFRPREDIELVSILTDFGTATQEFHIGAGSSAVPGFIPGLFAVHERLGRLPMARLAEQAVEHARNGFRITKFQAFLFDVVNPIYVWSDSAKALFAPEGRLPVANDYFSNPDLGDAIEAIAREDERIATEGEIARAMVSGKDDGCLRIDDLGSYAVEIREPMSIDFFEQTLSLNPPPSCGGSLIADMLTQHAGKTDAADETLRCAQAIAATDRKWRDANCDIGVFNRSSAHSDHKPATRGTTHISVLDNEGNAAAVTVSNGEGDGRIVPGCGFMVNNMLGEDDINPDGLYRWSPDTRLASMMAPTIAVNDRQGVTAIGSGGSNRIRTAVFQVLGRLFGEGMSVENAVAAARVHFEKEHLDFEAPETERTRPLLEAEFPDSRFWEEPNLYFGGVHVVRIDQQAGIEAAGDPRRAGCAVIV